MGTEMHIKELYYSNGMDIFGPVSVEAFSKNRYYRSTLIWYEGLSAWQPIEDCEELKHLIGTLHAPELDSVPHTASSSITPPLSKILPLKAVGKRVFNGLAILALLLTILVVVQFVAYINSDDAASGSETEQVSDSGLLNKATALSSTQVEAEKKTYRINWKQFITANASEYKQVAVIGGIKNLVLRLKNTSPYHIDSAKVRVSYIRNNGEVYQTELLQFDNIAAKAEKELYAPNSKKGVKVSCSIVSLVSGEMNLCYSKAAQDTIKAGSEDPCRCQ